MRHIILLSVACPALPCFFPHYHINGIIFGGWGVGGMLLDVKCEFWFSTTLSEIFLTLRRTWWDTIINVCWSSCILVKCWWNFSFLDRFSKNTQMLNFIKISKLGAELFLTDGRTDRQEEASSLCSQFFEKRLKTECITCHGLFFLTLGGWRHISFIWLVISLSVSQVAQSAALDGPGIESRWRRDFPRHSRPVLGPTQIPVNGYRVFPGGKVLPGGAADHSPLLVSR